MLVLVAILPQHCCRSESSLLKLKPAVLKLSSSFLYFYAYSFLRNSVQRRALARKSVTGHSGADAKTAAAVALSVYQELGIGYIAGVSSRLITTPLSVVTVRLQLDGEADDEDSLGVLGTVRELYHEDGIKGFWKGEPKAPLIFDCLLLTLGL